MNWILMDSMTHGPNSYFFWSIQKTKLIILNIFKDITHSLLLLICSKHLCFVVSIVVGEQGIP